MTENSGSYYDSGASQLACRYESVTFEEVHEWLLPYLPTQPSVILDIGAGSGRDAAALAERGHEVVAVEPSANMLLEARVRHPHPRIRWVEDRLPGLSTLFRASLSFDVILASAVWMHLAPESRKRGLRKILDLLKPGGLLALTLRQGPAPPEQGFYPADPDETVRNAEDQGVRLIFRDRTSDRLKRPGVSWTRLLFRLGDNGTEALPILRHAILHSDKSSTYKLGLLRAIVRLADQSPGLARQTSDDSVSVPLGQIGLNWIRIYAPLLAGNLPQAPLNTDREKGLGFAGEPWRRVFSDIHSPLFISPGELKSGTVFRGEAALLLHKALRDTIACISKNPGHYLTFPRTGQPVFLVRKESPIDFPRSTLSISTEYLWSFGALEIPFSIWKAMTRYAAWIEPALLDEWARLTRHYAERQDRPVDESRMKQALTWEDGGRDVRTARENAEKLSSRGRLFCVWTGKRLHHDRWDIDHCFPWAAWACNDLWNLLPASHRVNLQKSDRLPSAQTLSVAQERILEWWNTYLEGDGETCQNRFYQEAENTLGIGAKKATLDQVFQGLGLRRIALLSHQGMEEWSPAAQTPPSLP